MRAIILAAGLGKRLLPFTLNRPKPLLRIQNKTILEQIIFALQSHHIEDIWVITGHQAKQIESLSEKLRFQSLFFPNYATTNSAATLQYTTSLLEGDTLFINGDVFIKNATFLKFLIIQSQSTLIAQNIPKTTALTWGFHTDCDYNLLWIDTNSKGGLCECGISFICAKDIETFKQSLHTCNPNDYYEEAILKTLKLCHYRILEVQDSAYEIDSFKDAFSNHLLTPQEFASQCSSNEEAIRLGGYTNYNFKIEQNGAKVLRIPGIDTESFVDRELEKKITALIPAEISTQTIFYYDYLKVSNFLEGYSDQTHGDNISSHFLESLAVVLKKLHSIKLHSLDESFGFSPMSLLGEIHKYESLAKQQIVSPKEREFILKISENLQEDTQVLCHRDLLRGNVMYNGKNVKLVDFEYAGFCSKLWDIANFICEFEIPENQALEFINLYGGINPTEVNQARLLVHYIWGLWYIVNGVKEEEKRHLMRLKSLLKTFN